MRPRVLYVVSSVHSLLGHTRKLLLERAGFQTTVAHTTEAALTALSELHIDVVLVGSDTHGIDVARVLWSTRDHNRVIPIVLLSFATAHLPEVIHVEPLAGPGILLHAMGRAIVSAHGHNIDEQECVMFVDAKRRYFHLTRSASELLGYENGELIGRTIDEVSAPDMDVAGKFESYLRDGRQHGLFTLRHRNGHTLRVRYAAEVLHDGCMVSRLTPIA